MSIGESVNGQTLGEPVDEQTLCKLVNSGIVKLERVDVPPGENSMGSFLIRLISPLLFSPDGKRSGEAAKSFALRAVEQVCEGCPFNRACDPIPTFVSKGGNFRPSIMIKLDPETAQTTLIGHRVQNPTE